MSSMQQHPFGPAQVAEKVMRRVEIAKVARNLQDCLAFASFKAQHGWQDRTLRSIESEVNEQLKRKRPLIEDDGPLDTGSTCSEEFIPTSSIASNRFSKPFQNSSDPTHLHTNGRKKIRSFHHDTEDSSAALSSWKPDRQLPKSSPPLSRPPTFTPQQSYDSNPLGLADHGHDDSPMFDVHSEEGDHDLPMHSYANEPSSSIISSSPPRTPPPNRRLQTNKATLAGADHLLYLANSPSRSPAIHINHISSTSKEPPSTPPSQHTYLPSSVMQTPGLSIGLFNGALQTPGQHFNLADYCNVTPSPAQAHWTGTTPAMSKTPSRFARPGLNFDSLMPPAASPSVQRKANGKGLALQLGEELVPR